MDIRPSFGAILKSLRTVAGFNARNLTGPGCWAYPDSMQVGVTLPTPPGAKNHCESKTVACEMNATEWRSHFGAWCVTSSPLILSMDPVDSATLDLAWPTISNMEAIAVNQQWDGDSGRLHNESSEMALLPNCGSGSSCKQPSWMIWTKALPSQGAAARAAILLMNNGNATSTVSVDLSSVHGLGACPGGFELRDIWARVDRTTALNLSLALEPHDSGFFVAQCSGAPTPAPSPPPAPACLEPGVLYDSHVTGNDKLYGSFRQASNASECQVLCEGADGCSCFTHRISLGHCWLMKSCQIAERDDRYISGPAVCPAESLRVV